MRRIAKLKAVSSNSVRMHILSLVKLVRQQVRLCLSDKFALISDGWTESIDHYMRIWVSYDAIDDGDKDEFGEVKKLPCSPYCQ
jgi:hypothetical protein